jgi:hypothetical protein
MHNSLNRIKATCLGYTFRTGLDTSLTSQDMWDVIQANWAMCPEVPMLGLVWVGLAVLPRGPPKPANRCLNYWLEHISAIFLFSLAENSTMRFFIMQLNIFDSKDQYCKLLDNKRKRSTEAVTEQILWSKFVPIPYTKCCYNLPFYDDSYLKLYPPLIRPSTL